MSGATPETSKEIDNMNKVIKNGDQWEVTTPDGATIPAKPWTEKKTVNGKEFVKDWIVLPKGNQTGRTFIPQIHGHEFMDKTSGPRVLGTRLTQEAQDKIKELHDQIVAIKNDPANHVAPEKVNPNSEEAIMNAIKKNMAKLSPEAQKAALQLLKAQGVKVTGK